MRTISSLIEPTMRVGAAGAWADAWSAKAARSAKGKTRRRMTV
jgi:hypothetical protein